MSTAIEYANPHIHTNSPKMAKIIQAMDKNNRAVSLGRDDGAYTISEVLEIHEQHARKLAANQKHHLHLSITSHNMVYGPEVWKNVRIPKNISVRPGVEYEFNDGGIVRDVLLYFQDLEEASKSEICREYQKNVVDKAAKWEEDNMQILKQACAQFGCIEPLEQLPNNCYELGMGRSNDCVIEALEKAVFNNPETPYKDLKNYLLSNGYNGYNARRSKSTFYTHQVMYDGLDSLGNPNPFYCDPHIDARWELSDILKAAEDMGALVIIAHAGKYTDTSTVNDMMQYVERLNSTIKSVAPKLTYGFEVWHTDHSQEVSNVLKDYCDHNGLEFTGSSDFHKGEQPLITGTQKDVVLTKDMNSGAYYEIPTISF